MPNLTISAAARLCHCDRRTLQRAIHAGRLHLDTDYCLTREELLAAGYLLADTPQEPPQITPQDAPQLAALLELLERLTTAVEGVWQEMQGVRATLRQTPQGAPRYTPRRAPQETPPAASHGRPQGTPQAPAADADRAFSRMQALKTQDLTLAQIAAQLDAEGYQTKHGKAWSKSTVSYMLRTHGH